MTINEAFDCLGIDLNSSENEIKSAFRKLSLKFHPDLDPQKKNAEPQKKLNEAYEIAVAYSKIRTSIIPVGISNSILTTIEKSISLVEHREETNSYLKKLEIRKTGRAREIKYMIWGTTAMLAFITFLGKEVFTSLNLPDNIQNQLKIIPLITGCFGLYFQTIQDRIKNRIELLNEDYQDKRICAIKLSEFLDFKDVKILNVDDLLKSKKNEYETSTLIFFGGITKEEKLKILILKSKEHGLLEQENTTGITPETLNSYRLKFNPINFQAYKEESKDNIRTISGIKDEIIISLVITLVFLIACGGIIYFLKSKWAILPGLLGFIGLVSFISLLVEYKKAKKSHPFNNG